MKRWKVTGHLEVERKLPDADWQCLHQYDENVSIEQARKLMAMIEPVLPGTEHQLVYVRVETSREVIEP